MTGSARVILTLLAIFTPALVPAGVWGLALRPNTFVPGSQTTARGSVKPEEQQPTFRLAIGVVDENNVPVPSAQVKLGQAGSEKPVQRETDYAGRCEFEDLVRGVYQLRVEKEGFYAFSSKEVHVGEIESVEVTLNHQQEYVEVMNVVASPPTIDPAKTAATGILRSEEILHVPYLVTRDIRYALPLLPGVLQDATGQVHVDGSATRQTFDQLDGFNVNSPLSGGFNVRLSVDAIRSVEVQGSRTSAEYGKGSGGLLNLSTGMGDDHFRFSTTDFLPSLQSNNGIHINTWTPRATFSGPLRKGKAWFLEALNGEYGLKIIRDLPPGADRNPVWRLNNLARTQINLTQANRLTGSFLINRFRSKHAGLSRFDPVETTRNLDQTVYLFTVRDQAYLSNGLLVEVGLGVSRFRSEGRPLGTLPFVIRPEGTSGNFFETGTARSGRVQWITNIIAPPQEWHGRHEFKLGVDFDQVTDRQFFDRRPFTILREDGTRAHEVMFSGAPPFGRNSFEFSGFAQDRWSLSDHLLLESGIRFDRDQIVRRVLASPRLASTYLLTRDGQTKLSMGIGMYYDATNLDFITRPLAGQRLDLFFASDGQTLLSPPVATSFQVDERDLQAPRFLNWSVGLERKVPASLYLHLEFLQKRGSNGWTFNIPGVFASDRPLGLFVLRPDRRDHYDAFQVTLRRTFKSQYALFASYTRSAARSNAVLDFSLDNPVFSRQAAGPLPWDSPNRFVTWGWLPLGKGFELDYSLDWRDGYPFSLVNQEQQLVGRPGSRRFPGYFSLNIQFEHRFRVLGLLWALRAGYDDITNRRNPSAVNNNVDSPLFLTFSGLQGRALTGRIRFLGRK